VAHGNPLAQEKIAIFVERGLQSASKRKPTRLEEGSPLINPAKRKGRKIFFTAKSAKFAKV
jgi:hypothetical protein